MRKLVCLIAVVCFAAPAFAGDITFSASSSADGQFTIGYSATDPAEGPVGIGLKVTLSGACSASVSGKANVVSANGEFDVAIDYAHDMPDPNDYTIADPCQHPLADPCGAGVPDPCSLVFSLCMGRLDPCNLPSQSIPNLVTIELDCYADACCVVTVTIEEDDLRGGIVGAAWGTVNASDSATVVCAGIPVDVPPCWNAPTQCRGDYGVPADGSVSLADFYALKDSYGKNYCDDWNAGAGPYNPCADADRNGSVSLVDFYALKDHYGTSPPADCPGGGTWPPSCP